MAVWTYEEITPTLIPNTIMHKGFADGVHKIYKIQPNPNYVLHENLLDEEFFDEVTMKKTVVKFCYRPSSVFVTCRAGYDFTAHTVTDENGNTYTAYGNRDFFAIPENKEEFEND